MTIADKPFARVENFLLSLLYSTPQHLGLNEGYECCMVSLESWAELGKCDMGRSTMNLHRRYFPNLGASEGRRNRAMASALRGYSSTPPPMDPFSHDALLWASVDDMKGPREAKAKHGGDHAIGLARCYAASVVDVPPGVRFGMGRGLASLTYMDRLPRLLGGYIAVLGADVMAGMGFNHAVTAGTVHDVPALAEIRDLVAVGLSDDSRPEKNRYIPVSEVARMIGAFTNMDNMFLCSPPNERTYVMGPIIAPLIHDEVNLSDVEQEDRIRDVLTSLNEHRLARLHGDPRQPSERSAEAEVGGDHERRDASSDGGVVPPSAPAAGESRSEADDDVRTSPPVHDGVVEDVPLPDGGRTAESDDESAGGDLRST